MSALAKLMEARKQFHKRELKKTGWNDFSKFKYLELADFLIPAIEIFDGLKLAAVTSFTKELATMTITDLEDNSSVVITSPFGSAQLKACHEVQNIGAVETYQRRYLWVAALEIVEHDAVDSSSGKDVKKTPIVSATKAAADAISPEDRDYLRELAANITALVSEDRPRDAWEMLEAENLDDEQKPALWSMLGSGARSAIKKAKEPATV